MLLHFRLKTMPLHAHAEQHMCLTNICIVFPPKTQLSFASSPPPPPAHVLHNADTVPIALSLRLAFIINMTISQSLGCRQSGIHGRMSVTADSRKESHQKQNCHTHSLAWEAKRWSDYQRWYKHTQFLPKMHY